MEMTEYQSLIRRAYPEVSAHLPPYQRESLRAQSRCRTAALGCHAQHCEQGHLMGVWYNSCRHRSCPSCQARARSQWQEKMNELLLNCPHHHMVFTLPSSLNTLWRYNREILQDLFYRTVSETLNTFSQDSRHLGAKAGFLMVLHTWGRNLQLHPHIHTVISHGGLSASGEWIRPRRKVLFPRKPLMQVFRGKFLSELKALIQSNQLTYPPATTSRKVLNEVNRLGRVEWVVNASGPSRDPRFIVKYLARYIKGGAYRLSQLSQTKSEHIRFRYYSHQRKRREFQVHGIPQFLQLAHQHTSLKGKPTVRYGGLYSGGCRHKLNIARQRLGQQPVKPKIALSAVLFWQRHMQIPQCALCGELMAINPSVFEKKS